MFFFFVLGAKSLEQTCFTVLEKDLSTVHPNLFTSLDDIGRSQVEQLLRRLGVKSWSAKELINSHIIPTFNSDRWKVCYVCLVRTYLVLGASWTILSRWVSANVQIKLCTLR